MKKKLLLIPLAAIILLFIFDHSFVRLGLLAHGYPFAHIVPKRHLGIHIFDYVDTDLMQAEAVVFSHDQAIGWVYHGMDGFVQYVPFDGTRQFQPPGPPLSQLLAILALVGEIIYLLTTPLIPRFHRISTNVA